MRRGLPAVERVPGIRIDSRRLDADEELPAAFSVAELSDRPGRPKRGAVLRKSDEQIIIRNGRAARRAGDMARFPAKHLLHESPGIREGGLGERPIR